LGLGLPSDKLLTVGNKMSFFGEDDTLFDFWWGLTLCNFKTLIKQVSQLN
jgi:hypothetical protein